jgi:hypothetical protein
MHRICAALLALLLCLGTADCGLQLPAIVAAVTTVVSEAAVYLSQLKQLADAFFTLHPDPAMQKIVDDDVANTNAAMAQLAVVARGVADGTLTLAELKTAYEAFKGAWDKMLGDAAPTGVRTAKPGERLGLAASGLFVPLGEHFRPRGL